MVERGGQPESIGSMIKGKMKLTKDSHPCVVLLDRRWNGELNEKEFQEETAYWVAMNLDEYRHKTMPTPPADVLQIYSVTRGGGFKVTGDFYQRADVKAYLSSKDTIKRENLETIKFLEEIIGYIPDKDTLTKEKIQAKVDKLRAEYNADRDPMNSPSF